MTDDEKKRLSDVEKYAALSKQRDATLMEVQLQIKAKLDSLSEEVRVDVIRAKEKEITRLEDKAKEGKRNIFKVIGIIFASCSLVYGAINYMVEAEVTHQVNAKVLLISKRIDSLSIKPVIK